MRRIITEKRHSSQDAVFGIFYAKYVLPDVYKEFSGKEIFVMAINMRWDGFFGFVGGNVDPGENLREALVREVKEEINYDLDENKIERVCSHDMESKHIHLYKIEVSFEELKNIVKGSVDAKDFCSELGGLSIVHLENYQERGFVNFLKNNFISGAKEGLLVFLKEINPDIVPYNYFMDNVFEIFEELPSMDFLFEKLVKKYPDYIFKKTKRGDSFSIEFAKSKIDFFDNVIFFIPEHHCFIYENSHDGHYVFCEEELYKLIK